MPIQILPEIVAAQVYMVISFFGMLVAIARLRIPLLFIPIIVILTPLVWFNITFANIEWLIILGATLPPSIGIWLIILKPQMGVGILLMWAIQYRAKVSLFVPVVIVLIINFAVFGLPRPIPLGNWSYDVFPWGVVVGVMMVSLAVQENDKGMALAAGLAFSPYIGITSWVGTAGLAKTKLGLLTLIIMSWAIFLMWRVRNYG